MSWCEANGVDYLFGLAKNARLVAEIASELTAAEANGKATGQPARRFKEFSWSTRDSWSRQRRVIAKGGMDRRRRQSAFCRHFGEFRRHRPAAPLRGDVLRPRRHGRQH